MAPLLPGLVSNTLPRYPGPSLPPTVLTGTWDCPRPRTPVPGKGHRVGRDVGTGFRRRTEWEDPDEARQLVRPFPVGPPVERP